MRSREYLKYDAAKRQTIIESGYFLSTVLPLEPPIDRIRLSQTAKRYQRLSSSITKIDQWYSVSLGVLSRSPGKEPTIPHLCRFN